MFMSQFYPFTNIFQPVNPPKAEGYHEFVGKKCHFKKCYSEKCHSEKCHFDFGELTDQELATSR